MLLALFKEAMPRNIIQEKTASKGGIPFSVRLADQLGLEDHETRELILESTNSRILVRIGKASGKPFVTRSLYIEGILRWRGVEYEMTINDLRGAGSVEKDGFAKLHDRATGAHVEGDLPQRIYAALIPIIELQVQDQFERARRKKH